jgi:hypothetical protein
VSRANHEDNRRGEVRRYGCQKEIHEERKKERNKERKKERKKEKKKKKVRSRFGFLRQSLEYSTVLYVFEV